MSSISRPLAFSSIVCKIRSTQAKVKQITENCLCNRSASDKADGGQPCLCCGIIKCNLQTHLLLGLAVVWLHFQDPLETAAGSHGVSKQQVALALPQMALWVSDSEVHRVMTASHSYPSGNHSQDTMQQYICDKLFSTLVKHQRPSGTTCLQKRVVEAHSLLTVLQRFSVPTQHH